MGKPCLAHVVVATSVVHISLPSHTFVSFSLLHDVFSSISKFHIHHSVTCVLLPFSFFMEDVVEKDDSETTSFRSYHKILNWKSPARSLLLKPYAQVLTTTNFGSGTVATVHQQLSWLSWNWHVLGSTNYPPTVVYSEKFWSAATRSRPRNWAPSSLLFPSINSIDSLLAMSMVGVTLHLTRREMENRVVVRTTPHIADIRLLPTEWPSSSTVMKRCCRLFKCAGNEQLHPWSDRLLPSSLFCKAKQSKLVVTHTSVQLLEFHQSFCTANWTTGHTMPVRIQNPGKVRLGLRGTLVRHYVHIPAGNKLPSCTMSLELSLGTIVIFVVFVWTLTVENGHTTPWAQSGPRVNYSTLAMSRCDPMTVFCLEMLFQHELPLLSSGRSVVSLPRWNPVPSVQLFLNAQTCLHFNQ